MKPVMTLCLKACWIGILNKKRKINRQKTRVFDNPGFATPM
jgi:hypothetical protein